MAELGAEQGSGRDRDDDGGVMDEDEWYEAVRAAAEEATPKECKFDPAQVLRPVWPIRVACTAPQEG